VIDTDSEKLSQHDPVVTPLGQGLSVAAWVSNLQSGGTNVEFRVLGPSGEPISVESYVPDHGTDENSPSVVALGSSANGYKFAIIYAGFSPDPDWIPGVLGAIYEFNTTTKSISLVNQFQVDADPSNDSSNPAAIVANGRIVVAWNQVAGFYSNGSNDPQIAVRTFDLNGNDGSTTTIISDPDDNSWGGGILLSSSGSLVTAQWRQASTYIDTFNVNADGTLANVTPNGSNDGVTEISLGSGEFWGNATLANGNVLQLYSDSDTDTLYAREVSASPPFNPVKAPVVVNTSTSIYGPVWADVTTLPGGGYAIVWARSVDSQNHRLFARLYDENGIARTDEFLVSDGTSFGKDNHPQIARGPDGGIIIVWHSDRTDNGFEDNDIVSRLFANIGPTATGAPVQLAGVQEDVTNPAGTSISSLVSAQFDDQDLHTLAGVAVVGNVATAGSGVWQYSTDAGGNWLSLATSVSDTNATVLSASTLVRFLPALNYNGNPGSLSVRLWDGQGGFAVGSSKNISGSIFNDADMSGSTLTGAFTGDKVAIGVSVAAVNDAPTDLRIDGGTSDIVDQSSGPNTAVGTLSVSDPDGGSPTYSLVAGAGDTHNALFNVAGNTLRVNNPSAMAPGDYSVRVLASDGAGGTVEQVLTIKVADLTPPGVTSVLVPANGTYAAGGDLTFTANFNEAVTVETSGGIPHIALVIGSQTIYADYVSGSGTTALTFRYTVKSGEADANGITVATLNTNGGTIKDAAGNNAALTLNSVGSTAGVLIDGIAPAVASIARAGGTSPTNASTIDYIVTFSEAVTGVTADDFVLSAAGTASGQITSVTGSGTTYTVSVSNVSGMGTLRLDLKGSSTGIVDGAANPVASGYTSGQTYTIDTDAPATTIGSIAISADTGSSNSDLITRTATQVVTGTLSAALAGGDKVYGSTNGGTTWTDITASVSGTAISWVTTLQQGDHALQFKVTDAAGNDSPLASRYYTLDTVAPTAVPSSVAFSADTGASATDLITKTAFQTITGTLSANLAPGDTVYVSLDNGASWTAATINGLRNWSLAGILAGSNTLQVKVTDEAGNDGTVSSHAYVIDTAAPTTTAYAIGLSADTGSSPTDLLTNVAAQTVTATLSAALAAGERLYGSLDGGLSWSDITATVSGTSVNWTSATLVPGSHAVHLKVVDLAGNESQSSPREYVLDTDAPVLSSAAINSNTLVLTYTDAASMLDAMALPSPSAFTVLVDGQPTSIIAGSLDSASNTVTLTLASAVKAGQAVTISYTASGAHGAALRDWAGNLAANLTERPVINNTPSVAPTATHLTQTHSFIEDNGAVALDNIVITDPDSGETITATLTLSNPAAGTLSTGTYGSATSVFSAATGVWTVTGSVVDVNAALAAVSFTPAANWSQSVTITTRIRDAANAGPADGTLTLNGSAVNDAPVLADRDLSVTIMEDAATPMGAVGTKVSDLLGGYSDVDGGSRGIAVTAMNTMEGTWWFSINDGATWQQMAFATDFPSATLIGEAGGRVYFQPKPDYDGTIDAALTFRAWDMTSGTNGATGFAYVGTGGTSALSNLSDTVKLIISEVNDPATFGGANTGAVAEDGTLVASGILTMADLDEGQSGFQAQPDAQGIYGTFSFDHLAGKWTYALNNDSAVVQALRSGETRQETFKVKSTDGTEHAITVHVSGADEGEAVDGVLVEREVIDNSDGTASQVITIPVVTAGRSETDGAPSYADIPLVSMGGHNVLLAQLPTGYGLQADGPSAPKTAGTSLADLIREIEARTTAGSSDQSQLTGGGSGFLGSLSNNTPLLVQSITPIIASGATSVPGTPLVISGSPAGAGAPLTALVIDTHGLPSGTHIELQNVDFAALIGAVAVTGGAGSQHVWGDSANQHIVLGADDDTLHGGAGDDVVGSKGGRDMLFGDDGNDTVFGGEGYDRLEGGAGDDQLDGGTGVDVAHFAINFHDAAITYHADGTLTVSGAGIGADTLTSIELLHFADQVVLVEQPQVSVPRLFDEAWYLSGNPDVAAAVKAGGLASGLAHFLTHGAREGRAAAPGADGWNEQAYLARNPDVAAAVTAGSHASGFEHFLQFGAQEGRASASGALSWNDKLYLSYNPDVAAAVQGGQFSSGLEHFLKHGMQEGRAVYPVDEQFYLSQNPDVAAAVQTGWLSSGMSHYATYGSQEGRDPNALFDEAWYLSHNLDVAAAVQTGSIASGYEHYRHFGWAEGRDASAWFDGSAYLAANPDVAAAHVDPLTHYLTYGVREGRTIVAAGTDLWV
jgi:uncharacterized repeat protein (TIGR02059 family)